jgi:hypothetical protein
MYVVIGGLAGHGHELLILSKGRGKLIINLRRERVAGNIRVKVSHLSRGFMKLFTCRLRLEKFAEHQLP